MTDSMACPISQGSEALASAFKEVLSTSGWCVQACDVCDAACFPPRLRCAHCGSGQLRWEPIGEAGRLVSVVRVTGENPRHRAPRALRAQDVYVTGIVELAHLGGVRFPVLVLGDDARTCAVGDSVRIGITQLGSALIPTGRLADRP
jgi:uncharacterized OB-fold protein